MLILYSKMVILKRVTTPTYPHPLLLTHKKCPLTPTQPKYTFTYLHLSTSTHKNCPSTPIHPKNNSTTPTSSYLPIKIVHSLPPTLTIPGHP